MVRELSQEYFSSNRARTSDGSRGLLQAARVLSEMRPDEKRGTIQLAAYLALNRREIGCF